MNRFAVRVALVGILSVLGTAIGGQALATASRAGQDVHHAGRCLRACWCGSECHRTFGNYGYHVCSYGHSY